MPRGRIAHVFLHLGILIPGTSFIEPPFPVHEARAGPPPLIEQLREDHSPRTRTVSFVHVVRNRAGTALEEVEIAVAVPPSDERQTIHGVRFQPEPERTTSDPWEQRTAHFRIGRIPPGCEAEVRMTALVTLRESEWRITERDVGNLEEVPDAIARQYLRDGENYDLGEERIRKAARALHGPGGTALERVRAIHDFVIDRLEYDRDERWDSAEKVLGRGTGSCSEYAYVMIALCRASGIPARYAGGSRIAGRDPRSEPSRGPPASPAGPGHVDRVFHRWVEVYLPRIGWFPVDPTEDDLAWKDGKPYLCFGRLPWSYFSMSRGDGDQLEGGRLGWEYRSSTRWRRGDDIPPSAVSIERYAVWKAPEALEPSPPPPSVVRLPTPR